MGGAGAGTYPVLVSFPSLGGARYANSSVLLFTYQLIVSSFSPLSGGVAGGKHCKTVKTHNLMNVYQIVFDSPGGTELTVRGFGLSQNATVTVGGEDCVMMRAEDAELRCRTPAVSQ